MRLHRIIPVAPFVADPLWSSTQVVPPLLAGMTSATDIEAIQASGSHGTIYWTAIPYDGSSPTTAQPIDGTGMTLDARMVWVMSPVYVGKPSRIVVGRKSPGEVEGAPIPLGREIVETIPPRGSSAILQILSVAGVPVPVTHLYLFWSFEPQGIR